MVAAIGLASAAVGAYGAVSSSKNNKAAAEAGANATQKLDPRADAIVYGDGTPGNPGLLSQYQGLGNTPQSPGSASFGQFAQDYLKYSAPGAVQNLQNTATGLLAGNTAAPSVTAASAGGPSMFTSKNAQASLVGAPGQNSLNLKGAYDNVINGNAGENPYLKNALQSAVDQTNTSYDRNQTNLTNTLQRSVLPGIRSNSVLAGQYGGTRQGIAEGNAISDYTNQLSSANLALGQANSANTTGAQAQAFNQGQDRSLSALQSLSAQQYGAASQESAQQQATNLANANAQNAAGSQNAAAYNSQNQFNAGLQQQAGLANQGAQLQTNALNSNNQQAGLAGLSGLLQSQYGYAQNQDNYAINRAGQVNGLLAPYLGAGGSTNTTQPYASNTGANILGGATAGLGLFNGIKQTGAFDGWGNTTPNAQNITPGTY